MQSPSFLQLSWDAQRVPWNLWVGSFSSTNPVGALGTNQTRTTDGSSFLPGSPWLEVKGGTRAPRGTKSWSLSRKGSDKIRGMKSFYLYFLLSLSLTRDKNDGGEIIRKLIKAAAPPAITHLQSPEAPALCCVLGKKLELPNSQLQNIWVTLCSWIPGHTLCLAPTRSYWMFLSSHPPSFPALCQVFLMLPVPQQDAPCPTHKAENIPKCPQTPRAFSPFPVDEEAKPDARVCTQRFPWKTHSGTNKTTALGPKSLLRLPRMRHRELNPAEGGSCCSPSPPLQTLPALQAAGGHRRAQGPH